MRKHPSRGATMVTPLKLPAEVISGIKYHHERIDGKGYPEGLRGDQIPLFARILAVADSYDAITTGRPYKDALSKKEAIREVQQRAGTQFDQEIVDIFVKELKKK
jgi:HD-GYP domain-containing protein (c-di-GMP phosphodiesterase class II)